MHAEIDPRESDQDKHYRRCDPDEGSGSSAFYATGKNRCETGEETATRERVSTRKTICRGRGQIEKWFRARSIERQFQRDIQHRRADHREREKSGFAAPLAQREKHDYSG